MKLGPVPLGAGPLYFAYAASGTAAGRGSLLRGVRRSRRHRDASATRQIVLHEEEPVLARAPHDAQELVHARDFLELFVHEPLQEVPRDVVVLLDREIDQAADL